MSHPFEGWSEIGEGWDTGNPIENADLVANLKSVAGNFLGPVAMTLVAFWTLKLLLSVAIGLVFLVASLAEVNALYTVGGLMGTFGYLLISVLGLALASLYRPIQLQAFEGRDFVAGFGDAFRSAREVVGKAAICSVLLGVSMCIGGIACGIGALVPLFFFCQAPYLGVTTELSPMEAMRRSYELNKAYWMPVLGAVGASFIIMAVIQGCGLAIIGVISVPLSKLNLGLGSLFGNLGMDILSLVGISIVLVITGAVFTTIQSAERGVPFAD